MGDVRVITDMHAIINTENIKPGIDLRELQQKMINEKIITTPVHDPMNNLYTELHDTAQKLGIDFEEYRSEKPSEAKPSTVPPPRMPDFGEHDDHANDDEHANDDDGHADDDSGSEELFPAAAPRSNNDNLQSRTMEQRRREHIKTVMGGGENMFSLEKEKREDQKSAMLTQIDSLMEVLNDADVDVSMIPEISQQSSYEEVEKVLRLLRHKNDLCRYTTFAEEMLLFGAHAMGELFDGKRTWFDRYQPDLTGWHNHVNMKLKRMRHDTGQIVSTVMQEYSIGPGLRVLLELIPNMILYSKMRKDQHKQPSLFNDRDMHESADTIRGM
jgi:hypothetical protein